MVPNQKNIQMKAKNQYKEPLLHRMAELVVKVILFTCLALALGHNIIQLIFN